MDRQKLADLWENSPSVSQRADFPVREEEEKMEGDRPFLGLNNMAPHIPDGFQPMSDFLAVAEGGRQQKQPNPGRQVDQHLFPHHTPICIIQVMSLVNDRKINGNILSLHHGVIELVPKNLCCSNDQRGVRVLLPVAGQDTHVVRPKYRGELSKF